VRIKLILIKSFHTAIWFVMASAVFYIIYAGMVNEINRLVWFCIGLIFLEGVILFAFKWKCPLTLMAQKYADDTRTGFDIYLPAWLAKNNKIIFTILFLIGLFLAAWRVL